MRALITGGAGFIGCNVADHHLRSGDEVVLLDNLARPGTRANLDWLESCHASGLSTYVGDIRHAEFVREVMGSVGELDRVYHLAGQVAVTTSVQNPREDFEINALGTFNVLEAVRSCAPEAAVIYASTNKVYGEMEELAVVEDDTRYRFRDVDGIAESQPLDFHSPYGCSKGAGDQYVRDYSRIYGLRTIVMRQSCIYGPRQMGVEDQGWVAHFCIAANKGVPITIFGNGKQVRDVLWIDDLIAAYDAAVDRVDASSGQIYNIGGGPANTMSIWAEFGPILEQIADRSIEVTYSDWRPGDQPVYVSDITKAEQQLGWKPEVSLTQGVEFLWYWVARNMDLFS
ncbi:MAG: SDR family NAD(P)-dependent oxidoreductase [Acidimicrobiia bacterium]|nr:SDR family NAD(P)-dependent oxidoreductase [Acidimicrobiia bacterium]